MMQSNEVMDVAAVGMQTCLNATLHVERYSVREQVTDSRGECCLLVPRESVACSRTLYLSRCPTGRNQGVKGQANLIDHVPLRGFACSILPGNRQLAFWNTTFCVNYKKITPSKKSMR